VPEWEAHGGDVDAAADHYSIPRNRWLDLSTGISPFAYPLPELAGDYWTRLPGSSLYSWLHEAAASYYGAPSPAHVVAVPGTQSAIQWLPRLVASTRVAVVGPTYCEHAASWSSAGHSVVEIGSMDEIPAECDVIVLVRPNNPDGRVPDRRLLLNLSQNRLMVVDEAFADVLPEASLAADTGECGLILLRSFGKFFGLAGMRLGFVLAGEPWTNRIRQALGPWAVAGPAAAIGAVALSDETWIRATRVRLMAGAGRLDGLLVRTGLRVIGGTTLFRLVETGRAAELFEHLARSTILVRRFRHQPTWLRFGIPGTDDEYERLAKALAAWRSPLLGPLSSGDARRLSRTLAPR
jgi:cobalamin biosynthetic protein CobC